MVFDELISEKEAKANIQAVRTATGSEAAELWLQLGTFLFENGLTDWKGLSAEKCFRTAFAHLEPAPKKRPLADAFLGLGASLVEAEGGYRDPVLEEAIAHLNRAVELYQQQSDTDGEIRSRYYRAYALTELVGPERYPGTERAIVELEGILRRLRRKDDLMFWANAQTLLASAYADRVEGRPDDNVALAERAFRSALRAYTQLEAPEGRAQVYVDLAWLANRATRTGDQRAAQKAVRYARLALQNCTGSVPLELRTSALQNLATALIEREGKQKAADFRKAEQLMAEGIALGDQAASIGAHVMRLNRAALLLQICLDGSVDRGTEVATLLAECESVFDPITTTQWWVEWHRHRSLLAVVQDDATMMLAMAEAVLARTQTVLEQAEAFSEKSALLSEIAQICDYGILGALRESGPVGGLMLARRIFGRLTGVDDSLYEQPETTGEIYLLNPVTNGWCGILLTRGETCDLYELPGVGMDFWADMLDGTRPGFFSGTQGLKKGKGLVEFARHLDHWIEGISGAFGPLLFDLQNDGIDEIVLFAMGGWGTVPFAALQMPEGGRLLDRTRVTYGPDQRRENPVQLTTALQVMDPRLEQAEQENQFLGNLTGACTVLRGLEEVQAHLVSGEATDLIHFTCHGEHDFDYHAGAGIRCADGGVLTARWVFEHARLSGDPIVTLATCQSGLSDFGNLPLEAFGFPTAFIAAGARAVVSTLWPVDDLAARLLLERFYLNLKTGKPLSEALQSAQIWLREASETTLNSGSSGRLRFTSGEPDPLVSGACPFSHPFYWAGFILHRS
ncbi:MAG: hypothetical protein COC12_04380 [Rhodobacteraceae bacterium]|nr:MAG: hypothetical protein COC12_04380 [Paracoccaceae bacterium]